MSLSILGVNRTISELKEIAVDTDGDESYHSRTQSRHRCSAIHEVLPVSESVTPILSTAFADLHEIRDVISDVISKA